MENNKCHCCGQEIKQKKIGECQTCGNDTYIKVPEDDDDFMGKHTYRCKQCDSDWWCFFYKLAPDGEHLIKRFDDKGNEI
jgi:hypothetical protein